MRLLERDEPLAALHDLRTEAATEGGRLVFLEGEAGVGKTSLLGAFRASAPASARTLFGSCDPLSTPRPLGPLVDVADELDATFARLVQEQAPRDAVLGALLAALRRPGGELVLLLDDLHWADEATLDALRFVGRRIGSTRALVIGTYRDDEVGRQHPLRVVVGDLGTSPDVRRIQLRPLSEASVSELAKGTDLDPIELHQMTGGNPFFVTEVVAGAPARIPPTVRDAVLARVARLSEPARRTLEAAAVIGPTIEPELLARVVPEPAAEECLARGLLLADGRQYRFRHEVAREAILAATDPTVRLGLEGAVLAALERQPDDDRLMARLAHHAEGARDGEAVLRFAPRAGRHAAASGAHRQAAAQFARALRFADALPSADQAALLLDVAREHSITARYDVAIDAFARSAALYAELGDAPREAFIHTELARILVSAGRNAEAEAASRRALEIIEPYPDGPEKVEAIGVQAYLRMLDRDNAEAIELGLRAIDMAAGDERAASAVAIAWSTVGAARILLDDDRGFADMEASRQVALGAGIDRLAAGVDNVMASALGEMYRFAEAEPYFENGLRYSRERDLDSAAFYLSAWRSISLVHRGRWSEGGGLAAWVLASPNVPTISRIMALLAAGRLRARRGDPDAWDALHEALALSEPTGTLQRLGPVRAARAEAAWLEGDLGRAGEEASAVLDLAIRHAHPWHIGELSWWLTKAGAPPAGLAGAAEPWRHQLAGRWREAATAWLARECPYEAGRALLESNDVADVEEAHALFDRLGARPATAMAARRLRLLGARSIPRGPRPSTRANPAGLTARELEVLSLVVRGLPNHQIAARLFLSPRTVENHVSAVLGKLGVSQRGELATAAASAGIDPNRDTGDAAAKMGGPPAQIR